MIGHCWGGTFNCPASTCWLIDCALAHKPQGKICGGPMSTVLGATCECRHYHIGTYTGITQRGGGATE